jgi:hypothetical protein
VTRATLPSRRNKSGNEGSEFAIRVHCSSVGEKENAGLGLLH